MKATAILFGLVCFAAISDSVCGYDLKEIANLSRKSQDIYDTFQFGNNIDLLGLGNFFVSQIFVASTDWVFPTLPLLRTSPSLNFYKLDVCERADIKRCMYYGNSTNGLPERVQGIFWSDGLGDPTEAISSAGTYNVGQRKLTISSAYERAWAYTGTSSEWLGLFWSNSGAAAYNSVLSIEPFFDITFNEDITFGQIATGFKLFGIPILIPTFLINFTMTWRGDDTWERKSTLFFDLINITGGNYFLRRIINGDGSQGSWYNRGWLTYRNGVKVALAYKVFPPA